MTLSQAIRKGCPLVPATKGLAFRFEADGKDWAARRAHHKALLGADAFGTALVGLAGDAGKAVERSFSHNNGPLGVLYEMYPQLTQKKVQCPQCMRLAAWTFPAPTILSAVVWHLQDSHSWSREHVADYLEEIA
jgi:hypothetical protein